MSSSRSRSAPTPRFRFRDLAQIGPCPPTGNASREATAIGSDTVDGLVPSRDALTLGGGLTTTLADRLDLFADYHATLPTGDLLAQVVSAGLDYKF